MSKTKASEKLIEKIYRRKYEDIAMLFFVDGQRSLLPAISVEKALYNYFRHIGEENYNMESALTIYGRLKKEYYESSKTDC
jgi:hypothetical protein